jgi:hypothetical protein
LVSEPGHRGRNPGGRPARQLDLPAGLDGHRVIRHEVPGHGRDGLDALTGHGIGDVVQVNEMDFDLQADRADRRFGERRIT